MGSPSLDTLLQSVTVGLSPQNIVLQFDRRREGGSHAAAWAVWGISDKCVSSASGYVSRTHSCEVQESSVFGANHQAARTSHRLREARAATGQINRVTFATGRIVAILRDGCR